MKEKNIKLPADMLEIAKQCGLRLSCLNAYVACQARLCACCPLLGQGMWNPCGA